MPPWLLLVPLVKVMPSESVLDTPYTLALLSEYTHTLDALPVDISRNFGDLRELDAVLSSSLSAITTKIHTLTTMIEEGQGSKEDRLWRLAEIADEAGRLKYGGEDKIRVAGTAADNLKSHSNHLSALAEHIPGFNPLVLERKTVYPHVSDRSFMPLTMMETGRRRRGVLGAFVANPDPSPTKRKRVVRDDDADIGSSRTPKKAVNGEGHSRARNNARARKNERAISPSDSIVSVTSHLPPPIGHSTSARGGANSNARSGNPTASGTNKRARTSANSNSHRTATPLEPYPTSHDPHTNGHVNGSRRAVADVYNVPPSASHPSLPQPYQNGNGHLTNGYDVNGTPHIVPQEWSIPHAQQLEGPGMPVARSASIHSTNMPIIAGAVVESTDAGDGDADADDGKTYCFCEGISYGEMIACDDSQCKREWFHLRCIGLEVAPEGRWFCDACKNKKTKKPVRGGSAGPGVAE
ncbi:hypothetical protein CPB84DRAFT_1760563 [Gymnopilus junonius]|uniref:Chromatin modification-related protein n=1 Tax=Gymnopilus junonius TaxID=109634 RepID=A0A9P5TVF0_GYMJU|nr:hypothetical protein CPB84DRAFT_1760563 [Gymnopilus junonius]